MEAIVKARMEGMKFGEIQIHSHVAVIPMISNGDSGPDYGRDYRYEGKKLVGSALVHENTVIHMAFFQITETEKAGHMSSVSRRRAYRTNQ